MAGNQLLWAVVLLFGAMSAVAEEATDPATPSPAVVASADPSPPPATGEVQRLESMLRGELPEGVDLAQLFPFDLLDEALVAEQVEQLKGQIAGLAEDADPALRQALQLRLRLLSSERGLRRVLVEAEQRRITAQQELEKAEAERLRAAEEAKAAEQARRKALEAAEEARSAAEKVFATELAKVENTRLSQAQLREQLASHRVILRSGEIEGAGEQIRNRIQSAVPGEPGNRRLYDQCVLEVIAARDGLREALEQVESPVEVPRYTLPAELPDRASLADSRRKLEAAASALRVESATLAAETRRLRHDRAVAEYSRLERLNRSRIELLGKLADDDRKEILGLGRIGLDQFQRELEQLKLQFHWYRYARANLGFVWASVTEDSGRITRIVGHIVLFVLLCASAVWVSRRRQRWLDLASARVYRASRQPWMRRVLMGTLSTVERVFPELLLVFVAFLAPWALGPLAEIAEVVLAVELFQIFAVYRLLVVLIYLLISWLSVGSGVLPSKMRQLTLRSLRLIGVYALVTMVVLILSEEVLGRGYLYSLVSNIWWLGGIPIALVLIRWWQPDIADGYLALRDKGAMASAVRSSRDKWHGFFVTAVAVFFLIVVAVGSLATRFALGFDQTRKALAFLFRRRLERQADAEGEREQPALDPELLEVLSEAAVDDEKLMTQHFPGLQEFLDDIGDWHEGEPPAPTLLVGDTGFGKTTWLLSAQRTLVERGITVDRVIPPRNMCNERELLAWLSVELKLPGQSWEAFTEALVQGERRMVMIDDGHLLFSRAMNGFEAWDALCSVVEPASSKLMLMVAIARFPYDYLVWARNGQIAPFRHTLKLKPWSDEEIAALLRTRMAAAGYRVRYDDLVAERVEGVRQQTQMLRTEAEYARLIWDYSDGCPRTALRCWSASLEPAGNKTVSVRLFRRPDVQVLKRLTSRERLVLAALVWHQILTRELAAAVLRFPPGQCAETLAMLRDARVAREDNGVFRLESDWLQPVRRLLRRENLVVM